MALKITAALFMRTTRIIKWGVLLALLGVSVTSLVANTAADLATTITSRIQDRATRESLTLQLRQLYDSSPWPEAICVRPSVNLIADSEAEIRKVAESIAFKSDAINDLTRCIAEPAVQRQAQLLLSLLAGQDLGAMPDASIQAESALPMLHSLRDPAIMLFIAHYSPYSLWEKRTVRTPEGGTQGFELYQELKPWDGEWIASLLNEGIDMFEEVAFFRDNQIDPAEQIAPVMKAFSIALGLRHRTPFSTLSGGTLRKWAVSRCDKALKTRGLNEPDRTSILRARDTIASYESRFIREKKADLGK